MKKNIKIELINIRAVWIAAAVLFGIMIGLIPICCKAAETEKPVYYPCNDINLYGCSYDKYCGYLAAYFGFSAADSYIVSFADATYDDFVENDYSCLLVDHGSTTYINQNNIPNYIGYYNYYSFDGVKTLRFGEKISGSGMELVNQSNVSLRTNVLYGLKYFLDDMTIFEQIPGSTVQSTFSLVIYPADLSNTDICYKRDYYIVSHGRFYDVFDVLHFPENTSAFIEYGNEVNILTDFEIPKIDFEIGLSSNILPPFIDVLTSNLEVLFPVGISIVGIMVSVSLIPKTVYKFL